VFLGRKVEGGVISWLRTLAAAMLSPDFDALAQRDANPATLFKKMPNG
jgi:hypothetical protein